MCVQNQCWVNRVRNEIVAGLTRKNKPIVQTVKSRKVLYTHYEEKRFLLPR